jgi:hypothetical protein
VTITNGTNRLVGTQTADILSGFDAALSNGAPALVPELWDGRTAGRITDVFRRYLLG